MNRYDLSEIKIYPLSIKDIDQVYSIEVETFPKPWSKTSFVSQLLGRRSNIYLVAKNNNEVIGYTGIVKKNKSGHITTIAVRSDFKRKKIGTLLLISLIRKAIKRGIKRLFLEVRQSNIIAQKFYERFNFFTAGKIRRYYSDSGEDALIMVVDDITNYDYKDIILKLERELKT